MSQGYYNAFTTTSYVYLNYCHNTSTSFIHRVLLDSGASHHLVNSKSLFTNLTLWDNSTKEVTLADGKTTTPILGSGSITGTTTKGHKITIHDCLYVPTLSTSLISSKALSKLNGHYIHTANGRTSIAFPHTIIDTDDNIDDKLIFINLSTDTVTAHHNTTSPNLAPAPLATTQDPATTPTTGNPQEPNDSMTPASEPKQDKTAFQELMTSIISNHNPVPHWIKHRVKVSYRDNKGQLHRGVLEQTSSTHFTITIRKSKRQIETFKFTSGDPADLHSKNRLLYGHKHLLTQSSKPEHDDSAANEVPSP